AHAGFGPGQSGLRRRPLVPVPGPARHRALARRRERASRPGRDHRHPVERLRHPGGSRQPVSARQAAFTARDAAVSPHRRVKITGSFRTSLLRLPAPPPWNPNASTRPNPAWRTSPTGSRTSGGIFDFEEKKNRLVEVNSALEAPDVWDDSDAALALGREKRMLEDIVERIGRLSDSLRDARELFGMAVEEDDDDTIAAVEGDVNRIEEGIEELEFRRMFSNPADPSNCFIEIQAGAGGTEACDWAAMLLRQYLRYC